MDTARAQVSKSSERSIGQTHGEPGTKVTLPTGENISKYQQLRRVHIPGFPATTERLPEGIETEDIIKQWPNHLWGPLLLQVIAHWSPKQISNLSGGRLKPNSIVKRVKAARIQAGDTQGQAKSPKKGGKNSRKRKRDTDAPPRIREEALNTEQLDVESEASRQFRISQMEIEDAVKAKDPNYELRQIGLKKMPRLDRILIDQAFEERKVDVKSR
ncbi:hypothetical protein HO173_002707 [Letharia columbiana]|uniref:Uncharacterized protein n=1 Tax=Letharia columbiana TaxID=112416 RepID=A0A8H6G2P7_9LECA|nr:uncharacterized protein HO173_002707 [Letharia columbiana]KAF6239445.1 hypothetical protein HO173_002707 [Letharia columbiana]